MMSDDLRHNYLRRREPRERTRPVVPVLDLRAAFLACFDGEADWLPDEADAAMQDFVDAMTTRNTIRIDKPMSFPDPDGA